MKDWWVGGPYHEESTYDLLIGSTGVLTEKQLDALEWARKFMNDYERKNKLNVLDL